MSESYSGEVRNGVVVFDEGTPLLPEGTKVRVEPEEKGVLRPGERSEPLDRTRSMLLSWARRAEAVAPPLPPDLAENHDHYAHGKPRG